MKIALLIVDMQSIYLQEDPVDTRVITKACMYINHVSHLLRSNDHIVIHIQDVEGLQQSNKEMYEIIPDIQIHEKDIRMAKKNTNAFWKTELEQVLLEQEVGLVIVSGFAAEHCVLGTYHGAIERGFKAVMLQNGIISTNLDVISSTYRDRFVISYPVVEYLINPL